MRARTICSFLLLALAVASAADPPCLPCDPSWPRPLYYPNYDDCKTIWECSNGKLTLTACDNSNVFDFMAQACVPPDDPTFLYTCTRLLHTNCTA